MPKSIEESKQQNKEAKAILQQIQGLEDKQKKLEPGDPEQITLEQEVIALRKKLDRLMRK